MSFVLIDLPTRVKECQQREEEIKIYRKGSNKKIVISKKLWQIIPNSCKFQPALSQVDSEIHGPWKVKDVEKQLYATRRVFPCNLWRISVCMFDFILSLIFTVLFWHTKCIDRIYISDIQSLTDNNFLNLRHKLTSCQHVVHFEKKFFLVETSFFFHKIVAV